MAAAATASATAPESAVVAVGDNGQPLFTCLSCNIAFPNAHDQRTHYRTDWHRYNAKRRVAQLPPIRQDVFQQKVVAASTPASAGSSASSGDAAGSASSARAGNNTTAAAGTSSAATVAHDQASTSTSSKCDVCNKSFSNPNIMKDHLQSKKHKDQALGASLKHAQQLQRPAPAPATATAAAAAAAAAAAPAAPAEASATAPTERPQHQPPMTLNVPDNATEEEINALIDAKLKSATRIDPATHCLFCTTYSSPTPSLDAALEHMQRAHGFFLPEREYLIDLPGLMTYLADKITVGNICLYCNARGKSFASLDAVRKHMLDKSHCKLAYTEEDDIMELSDFYDFSSSYPDEDEEEAEWEDMDGVEGEDVAEEDNDEDVEMDGGASASTSTAKKQSSASGAKSNSRKHTAANTAQFDDTGFELVLPSGIRLGHRALHRYYKQTLWTTPATQVQQEAELSRQRRLLTASDSGVDPAQRALIVPNRGGRQNAIVARSKGQAREAMRHVREFRDVQRREAYKTRVAYTNNNQKHFRDPLLQ
ncbi:pre-60S factor rei1 [Tilletia horrida]|nr:pre-60S factor rei1 [Tilletia horrida]